MTTSPGGDPQQQAEAPQAPASNWAAGERRPAPRWLAWLAALPSAGLLLVPTMVAIADGESAYDVGRATGRAGFALLVAVVGRGIYVGLRRRPWRSVLSPWLLPLAALVLILTSAGRVLPELAERQGRVEGVETMAPADYLRLAEPYELTELPPDEAARLEAEMASTLSEARATDVETRYVERDGEAFGVVMVMAIDPEVAADPEYLEDVYRGAQQAGSDPSFGTVEGQSVVWGRVADGGLFVTWQHEALVITAFAIDRPSAEEIARRLIAANRSS